MIALSLRGIELGLKSPMQSFPSIELQLVAGWEYACLSQNTVEGCFLEGKLLKKLEIFFIPDPAAVNVHKKNSSMEDLTLIMALTQAPILSSDMETRTSCISSMASVLQVNSYHSSTKWTVSPLVYIWYST